MRYHLAKYLPPPTNALPTFKKSSVDRNLAEHRVTSDPSIPVSATGFRTSPDYQRLALGRRQVIAHHMISGGSN